MWGHYSYFISTLIFTGIPTVLIVFFFYRLIMPYMKMIRKLTLIFLVLTPFLDGIALSTNAWQYAPDKSLGIVIFGGFFETLVVTFFITIAVSSMTIVLSHYVDKGESILPAGINDAVKGKHAIWMRK